MFGRQQAKYKIKRPQKEIEFHEVLLDSLAQKKERELGLSEQKLEVLLPQKILQALWLGFLILTLVLFRKPGEKSIRGLFVSGIFVVAIVFFLQHGNTRNFK